MSTVSYNILRDFEYMALESLVPEHLRDDVIAWAVSVRVSQALLESVLERRVEIIDCGEGGPKVRLNPEYTAASETERD